MTLVTYDQSTIPNLLIRLAEAGVTHAGVIFVDERTIPSHDFGGVLRALAHLWKQCGTWDWSDRVVFLRPVP